MQKQNVYNLLTNTKQFKYFFNELYLLILKEKKRYIL